MTPELTQALQNLLVAILSVVALVIGHYGRKYMLALESKAVDEGAAVLEKTKIMSLEAAHALLLGLVRAADNSLLRSALASGEDKEQWIVDQARRLGIVVTLAQVKAAYEQLKAEAAKGGTVQ